MVGEGGGGAKVTADLRNQRCWEATLLTAATIQIYSPSFFFLLFLSSGPHPPQPFPASTPPPPTPPTADDATAGGADGGDTGLLPEPHGCHRCCTDAADGSVQRQRAGGHTHDSVLRWEPETSHPTFTPRHLSLTDCVVNIIMDRFSFLEIMSFQPVK